MIPLFAGILTLKGPDRLVLIRLIRFLAYR